ncbi:formate dehydrogenase subunit alpha [Magnetovibrio blakemorei]|uniref:Formate dehydrogenase subunit alpha n=1 Tax=Magnetovibrio blakemorei TaxID=28181 RepID=A0A1E5Q863_9PROT|nr:formate dehydrogenase subunit alpha [Magnetovibrio blakemorei]OEJ67374.1 formate dehydrogenase subunit alpha [Magnetovibrio blakemorei]
MTNPIAFTLNGQAVTAESGETIWQAAKRHGIDIEHLCYKPRQGYRADGNCRACLVEVKGERTLAASCRRPVQSGMDIRTDTPRAQTARRMVVEMLLADHPGNTDATISDVRAWADHMGLAESRFASPTQADADQSHPAIHFKPSACITCGLCIRACRDVQSNDVIGFSGRGAHTRIVFDQGDDLGNSTCVACGECVEACPTGALRPAHEAFAPQTGDQKIASTCPFCGVGCQIEYTERKGKIVLAEGLDGPSNHHRLCVKGRFGFSYTHNVARLTKPLIRKGGAAKTPADIPPPDKRLDAFREATWDEALALAADGFKTIRARDGGAALSGFGSAKGSNEEAYLFQKLIRTAFGSNNVDHCTRLCHASSVAALLEGVGSAAVTAPFMAAEEADVIILIGSRPEWNHPVAAACFKTAAKRGAKLIIFDPRGQGLARYGQQLNFKSGTDVALINALLHTIIFEGLTDQNFIAKFVDGYDELVKAVKDYTPERMADLTGIDASILRQVARQYATAKRSIIFWGMGVSQHVHGTDNARALIALALITGHIGRPGTGLHPLRGQNNVQGASDVGLIPMFLPDYASIKDDAVRARFEAAWGTKLSPIPGLTVVETMDAANAGVIKGMYVMGENPAMSDPDANHARAGLAKLEHLVVQDIFLTETAWLADVILPASTFYEKTGTYTNTNRQVQMGRKVVHPPGDARQDFDLICNLAERLGCAWNYAGPEEVYAEMRTLMPSISGISWDRLQRDNSVVYPCTDEHLPGQDILFGDGFPTASGRARLVPADLTPPDEMPDEAYPFLLTTGRVLEHWHTGAMTRPADVLNAIEPHPTVSLHPKAIGKLGVSAGAHVKVESRRGEVELMVRADRDVPEGLAFIPFCFHEAAANLLTNPKLDPYGKIPEFKVCAVKVTAL